MKAKLFSAILWVLIASIFGGSVMASYSMPWSGTTQGDAGPYTDIEWATMYSLLFGAEESARGPLLSTENDALAASERGAGANMSVDVSPGSAMVDGRFFNVDAITNLAIATADGSNPRWDLVVARSDSANQVITLAVKTGTPAGSPVVPSVDVSGSPYFEIPLARVYVPVADTTITDDQITDVRAFANLPMRLLTEVTNKSGGELLPGAVVIWDNSNAGAVTTTTAQDSYLVAGVVADTIANNANGRICQMGVMPVDVDGAVGIGNALVTSTTVTKATVGGSNVFARALESTASAGRIAAMINVAPVYPSAAYAMVPVASYSINTNVFTDIDAVNLAHTIVTSGGPVRVSFNVTQLFIVTGTNQSGAIDVEVDGTRYSLTLDAGALWGLTRFTIAVIYESENVSLSFVIPNLAAGSHTFKLQWMRGSTPGSTVYAEAHSFISFNVEELINN